MQENPDGRAGRRDFVPALGRHELTGAYDRVVALVTRERSWRRRFAELIDPQANETIVDVGCGTGTQAIMLSKLSPNSRMIGFDPDDAVLEIARAKARQSGVEVDWRQAMGDEVAGNMGSASVDKAVTSLVLHQCPMSMKRSILIDLHTVLAPAGRLFVADYGQQRTAIMRLLFRQVQMVDGFENTQPNADGVLPTLLAEAGFVDIVERYCLSTLTGSISIYTARKVAA